MASKCKHVRIFVARRKPDEYGHCVKCSCSCGRIKTNWHTEEWKARIAFEQNRTDKYALQRQLTPTTIYVN